MQLETVEYLGYMMGETIVTTMKGTNLPLLHEFQVLKQISGKDVSFIITKDFEHHEKALYTFPTFKVLKTFLQDVGAEYDLTYHGKRYFSFEEKGMFVPKRHLG